MKKFAKLSLVAAVAVTGLTSANATALEEAIKGVDVSGTVVYRYDDSAAKKDENKDLTDSGINKASNNYKAVLNVKTPIYDDMSANLTGVAGSDNSFGFASLGNSEKTTTSDGSANISLSKANFAYTGIMNTTVVAGKQGLATPWTQASDSDNNEQTGTGALALTTVGPVTAAAGYFNQTNLGRSGSDVFGTTDLTKTDNTNVDLSIHRILNTAAGNNAKDVAGTKDIVVAALMGNAGPVALEAWYLDMADIFDTYTLSAKGEFKAGDVKLTPAVRYTSLSLDKKALENLGMDQSDDKNSLISGELKAKYDIFGGSLAYGKTGKKGGVVALDNDADAGFQGWYANVNGRDDANLTKLNVNVQAIKELNVAINYNILKDKEDDAKLKQNELYTQLTWTPAKNFTSYARLGQFDEKWSDDSEKIKSTIGRLQAEYKF